MTSITLFSPLQTILTPSLSISSLSFSVRPSCTCEDGFDQSDNCAKEIDECAKDNDPCHFEGKCHDLIDGYECECPAHTSGVKCSIVCPSASCEVCTATPCFHGGTCSVELNGEQLCNNCPSNYKGPRCELTTSSFHGDGYIQVSTPPTKTSLSSVFSFATVSPDTLLMYTGQYLGSSFLSISLASGSLSVDVKLDDSTPPRQVRITSQTGLLSDGQWHTVTIDINKHMIGISVSECTSSTEVVLEGQDTMCASSLQLDGTPGILPLNTPVYFGGYPSSFGPLVSVPLADLYSGCLRDVYVDRELVDFSSVIKEGTINPGCSQSNGGTCQSGCTSCVNDLWNGATCNDEQGAVSLDGTGLMTLVPNTSITVEQFHIRFRTLQSNAALAQLSKNTTIQILDGSLVFSHFSVEVPSFTLIVDGFFSDGNWHLLTLLVTEDDVQLSLDNGRVLASANQSVSIVLTELVLGGIELSSAEGGVTRGLDGCLQKLRINNQEYSLVQTVQSSYYNLTKSGVIDGCSGGSLCNSSMCQEDSSCSDLWREFSCECSSELVPIDNKCENLCDLEYCNPLGTSSCRIINGNPLCVCERDFRGSRCEFNTLEACPTGYHRGSDECIPCKCDVNGVTGGICNFFSGDCECTENTYSPPDDIGCQLCNCDPIGSLSAQCDTTSGQCECRDGVGGRQCDSCLPGFVGMGENGCQKAPTVVEGSFAIDNLQYCTEEMVSSNTADHSNDETLLNTLTDLVLYELQQFILPSVQEIRLHLTDKLPNVTTVTYTLSSFISHETTILTPPTPHTLLSIMQTIVQRGNLNLYLLVPDSHVVTSDCSIGPCPLETNCSNAMVGVVCSGCANGTFLNGIVCRSISSQDCGDEGEDSDFDGVPDLCDNCPYYFNPNQYDSDGCGNVQDACPNEAAEGVLWAITEASYIDIRKCPAELTGIATRRCNESSQWEEPDLSQCLTRIGEELQKIISSINENPPNSRENAVAVVTYFEKLVQSNKSPTIADLNTTVELLDAVSRVETLLPYGKDVLEPMSSLISSLLSDQHTEIWLAMDSGKGSSDLLALLEKIGRLVATGLTESKVMTENDNFRIFSIVSSEEEPFTGVKYVYNDDQEGSISIPENVIERDGSSSLGVSVMYMPTLINSLPQPQITNITSGAPVVTLKLVKDGATSVSELTTPINLTFPHVITLDYFSLDSVICATWDGQMLEWTRDGCEPVAVTTNWTICSCSHLSSFTLLHNLSVQAPPPSPPQPLKSLSLVFITPVFVISCLIITAALIVLLVSCFRYGADHSFVEVWIQLLLAILLFLVLFIAGLYSSNDETMCIAFGILLFYFPVVVCAWFLIGGIAVIADLKSSWNSNIMKFTVSGMAWILSLFYTGVSSVVMETTAPSLSEAFGYPQFCWISLSYFFLPLLIALLGLCGIVLYVCALVLLCAKEPDPDETEKAHKQRSFSCSILIVAVVFLSLYLAMASMIYTTNSTSSLHTLMQSISAILSLALAVILLIITLIQTKVIKFLKDSVPRFSKNVKLEIRRSDLHQSSVSSRRVVLQDSHPRTSLASSIRSNSEHEYHMIDNNASTSSLHRLTANHPMHSIRIGSQNNMLASDDEHEYHMIAPDASVYRQTNHPMHPLHDIHIGSRDAVNQAGELVSCDDREVEHIFNQQDDGDMIENARYGVVPQMIPLPPSYNQVTEQQESKLDVEEDSQWFNKNTPSPCHLYYPSSVTTMTPTPMCNRIPTEEEEAEIEKLYQLARNGSAVDFSQNSSVGQYAEIRPLSPPMTNSNNRLTVDNVPWYKTPDSEVNYPTASVNNADVATPSLEKYTNEEAMTSRPLPSPPHSSQSSPPSSPAPPIPPRQIDPPSSNVQQFYSEVGSVSSPPHRKNLLFNANASSNDHKEFSATNRCASLTRMDDMSQNYCDRRRASAQMPSSSNHTHSFSSRPGYPNASLDRRRLSSNASNSNGGHFLSRTNSNAGDCTEGNLGRIVTLHNGSQTFQSLV